MRRRAIPDARIAPFLRCSRIALESAAVVVAPRGRTPLLPPPPCGGARFPTLASPLSCAARASLLESAAVVVAPRGKTPLLPPPPCGGARFPTLAAPMPAAGLVKVPSMGYSSPPDLLVLHAVRVLGMADGPAVARRFGLDPAVTEELLLDFQASGWIQRVSFADISGWALTDAGRAEDMRRLSTELD